MMGPGRPSGSGAGGQGAAGERRSPEGASGSRVPRRSRSPSQKGRRSRTPGRSPKRDHSRARKNFSQNAHGAAQQFNHRDTPRHAQTSKSHARTTSLHKFPRGPEDPLGLPEILFYGATHRGILYRGCALYSARCGCTCIRRRPHLYLQSRNSGDDKNKHPISLPSQVMEDLKDGETGGRGPRGAPYLLLYTSPTLCAKWSRSPGSCRRDRRTWRPPRAARLARVFPSGALVGLTPSS